jgi:hypothetical protein
MVIMVESPFRCSGGSAEPEAEDDAEDDEGGEE